MSSGHPMPAELNGAQPPVRHPEAPPPGTVLPSHYHRCYGCGPEHAAGLRMRTTVGEDVTIHARFEVTEAHQGAPGLAHGGLLSCAMDEALGTVAWLLGTPAVTARLETNFRTPVPVGSVLHINAHCIGVDGRKIFLTAKARIGADGPVAVQANALFLAVDLTHFTKHGQADEVHTAMADPDFARTAFGVNP